MIGITVATIYILLSGGGDFEHYLTDITKKVKSHVEDKVRREIILDESKALSKSLKGINKEVNRLIKDMAYVHEDFQSAEADFDAVTERLVAEQQKAADRILDAREKMREIMSAEEWSAVFGPVE